MTKTFKCILCGKTFSGEHNEEEALKEMKANFGKDSKAEDMFKICHECYMENKDIIEADRKGK